MSNSHALPERIYVVADDASRQAHGSCSRSVPLCDVFESDAAQAFGQFLERQVALSDMAPTAEAPVLDGIEESPDGGAAMAEAHVLALPDSEREQLVERAAAQTGRRLHAAALALLTAVDAARLPVEITPEMVAVAAITELGDSIPPDSAGRRR